ncbi:MAG: hypothetical protein R3F11_06645 [Verrucomicrobiales bacterium]
MPFSRAGHDRLVDASFHARRARFDQGVEVGDIDIAFGGERAPGVFLAADHHRHRAARWPRTLPP